LLEYNGKKGKMMVEVETSKSGPIVDEKAVNRGDTIEG
jgi:hypothetical protein